MVTIVSGLPRSGTSLMMRMLEAGGLPPLTDGIRAPDIDNPNGYYEFEPVKSTDKDAAWLTQAEGHAVKMVYKLLETLPPDRDYRVVFMQRRLKEVVASQNRMLRRLGVTADAAEAAPGETFRWVGMLADEVARCRAWLKAQPRFAVLYVNYNRLIEAPGPVIEALVAFCGGSLDADAMRRVIDPTLYRRRVPT